MPELVARADYSGNASTEHPWPSRHSPSPSLSSTFTESPESDYYPTGRDGSGHIAIDMSDPTPGPMSNTGPGLYNIENHRFYAMSPNHSVQSWGGESKGWVPENVAPWLELAMDALPILVKGVGKFVPPPSGPYIYALGVLGTGAKGFHTVAREAMNYASGNQVNLNRALGGAGMAVGAGLNGGGYFPGFDQHTAKLMQGVGETLESVGTGLKGGADISDLHARRGGHPEPSPLPATDDSFNSRTAAGVAAHMRSSHLPAPTATPYSGGTTRLPQLPAPSAGRTR